jgi:DNA-binding transcriptional ArsR family regulator
MSDANLDRTFAALADPTRRAILERLRAAETMTVSELAAPFTMSLPAVMKHVAVLEAAGLVVRRKVGRTVHCRFEPVAMRDARVWLEEAEAFWTRRREALAGMVESEAASARPEDGQ